MTAGEPWPAREFETATFETAAFETAAFETAAFETVDFELSVNGATQPVAGAWVGESLLFALRERLGLVAAKDGCGEGECGACTILMDGQPAAACLVPAVAAVGRDVCTPEFYAVPKPDAVATSLATHAGTGCGFCLPGIGMELRALLARNPKPGAAAVREALSGHRCRCLPAEKFVEALRAVLTEHPASRTPGPATLQHAVPDRPGRPAPPSAPPALDESGSWSWQSGLGEAADRP